MATSDKMDVLARRRCVFFSMKYFKEKKKSLSSVCLHGESLYGRMKMSLVLRRKVCVYTEYYITEQRSTGCSLSRLSNKFVR